jgi:putrescine transport system permease protein
VAAAVLRRALPDRPQDRFSEPLVMPEVIIGLSLSPTLIAASMDRGIVIIVIAHATFTMCYVTAVAQARLAGFDVSVEEAATDLGARPGPVFRRVNQRLTILLIIDCWQLLFMLSLVDLVIANFLAEPGAATPPIRVSPAERLGVTPEINAIRKLIVGVVAIGVVVWPFTVKQAIARRERDARRAERTA